VAISNPHNLHQPPSAVAEGTYGVRVSLPEGDPLTNLHDVDWTTTHWFVTAAERDAALTDMRRKHEYSRPHDKPALIFTTVDRDTIA